MLYSRLSTLVNNQLRAVLYVTTYRNYFRMLWPAPVFSQRLLATGYACGYTINNICIHLSVVVLLLGLVHMTRAYLATATRLQKRPRRASCRAALTRPGIRLLFGVHAPCLYH